MAETDGTWTVTRTREDFQWVDGQYAKGVSVYFTTGHGQMGSVFVPEADFTPARVRDLIAPRAAALDDVLHLTGG